MEQRIVGNSLSLDRERLIRWVRKWGDVNADGLLDEHCQVFFIPEVEGFIGYKIEGSNAIVFGDPTCSPADKPLLAKAFDTECQKKNLGVVYTIVSEEFMEWASKNLSAIAIEYGTTLVLDPHDLPTHHTGSKAALVRKKVKHALKEGIQVKEYFGDDPHLEKEMDEIAKTWVETRKGFQIYLCPVNLFENRYGKRWFYAQQNNKVVGLAILNELQEQKGWLLNNIFTINHNSNGLSELMIISVLEALEKKVADMF